MTNFNNIDTSKLLTISNDEYHANSAISKSGICEFKKSPLHYWHTYLNPFRIKKEKTPALILGDALHVFILEEELFHQQFFIAPKVDKRTTEGKKLWAKINYEAHGKTIITQEDFDYVRQIAHEIKTNSIYEQLIKGALYEKSIFWQDPDTGLICKCRPDILHSNFVCDLKSAADASNANFQRDFFKYGYHMQAAMIRDGLKISLNVEINDYIYIAFEKEPPYASAVYPISTEVLDFGQSEYKKHLQEMKICFEKNDFPSYQNQIITLPQYFKN